MTVRHCLALSTLAVLAGSCGKSFEVTRNGEPWSFHQSAVELTTGGGSAELRIVLSDPGPPGVSDAGSSYDVVVDLDESALEGPLPRTLVLNGTAVFEYVVDDPTFQDGPLSFEPGASHDPSVSRVFVKESCFCYGPPHDIREEITGTLVLEERTADGSVSGRIDVTADPIPMSFGDRVAIEGAFIASLAE